MKQMKYLPSKMGLAALLAALAGCGTTQDMMQPRTNQAATQGMAGSGMAHGSEGNQMGMMDMKSMCDMHAKMAGKTMQEKKSMMQAHGGMMSEETMQKHMKMMDAKC